MGAMQIRGNTQIIAGSITNAEINASAAIALSKLAESVIQADGGQAFTGEQSMGSNKLTNVTDPTSDQDAATKAYVDSVASGLDIKDSVRVATTADGALATAYENGDTVDGVVLATNDRILLKNQTSGAGGSENGIYTVNASGAPTRATDADTAAEMTSGMFTFVEEGTTNADSGWVMTNDGAIVVDTTALVFSQFSGAGMITAGTGLTKSGDTINVISANGGIVANADDITLTLDGSTLTVGAGGLKLSNISSTNFLVGNGSSIPTAVAMSGDATMANTGVVTAAADILKEADVVTRQTPTGAINSSNVTYTLANTPIVGTEQVFLNGILQEAGSGDDYQISGATITYETAPVTGDILRVNYLK